MTSRNTGSQPFVQRQQLIAAAAVEIVAKRLRLVGNLSYLHTANSSTPFFEFSRTAFSIFAAILAPPVIGLATWIAVRVLFIDAQILIAQFCGPERSG